MDVAAYHWLLIVEMYCCIWIVCLLKQWLDGLFGCELVVLTDRELEIGPNTWSSYNVIVWGSLTVVMWVKKLIEGGWGWCWGSWNGATVEWFGLLSGSWKGCMMDIGFCGVCCMWVSGSGDGLVLGLVKGIVSSCRGWMCWWVWQ